MTEETAEPDLTPMLDVVFILLIFFIVTATFVNESGISVPGQNSEHRDVDSKKSIVLEIRENNRYYLNNLHVDKRALINQLARLHAEDPSLPLVIAPDRNASTDLLVHAMDAGSLLGIDVAVAPPAHSA